MNQIVNIVKKWMETYDVDNLLLCEAILAELGQEDLDLASGTTIQVGEAFKNLGNLLLIDIVIDSKKFVDLVWLYHDVRAQ